MSKVKISEYFNPAQHLVFHQDKEGCMIGGGYQVNNLLYQRKMPLFVSVGDGNASNMEGGGVGAGGSGDGCDNAENKHFIPEKFSDLFQDLAVPAGLFMMPALFRPRNYAFEKSEQDEQSLKVKSKSKHTDDHEVEGDGDSDSESDSDDDSDHGRKYTKQVPGDIFDTLLSMVTPTERIQHDVKTRRRRGGGGGSESERKTTHRKNRTRRRKTGVAQEE